MDSVTKSFDLQPQKPTPKLLSFPNGTLRKHLPRPPAAEDHHQYRECLRNHAASLGGHAVDGCCEFMPSPSADPAVPTSLTCAACGCHRNFHRRLPLDARLCHDDTDEEEEEEEQEEEEEDDDGERRFRQRRRRRSSGSPPPYSSAPHMLLALSGAGTGSGGPVSTHTVAAPITVASMGFHAVAAPHATAVGVTPRKRFRTKFSTEQKERMQEMSERLGWRMQKKDEAVVEEFCRQIGIERGVFKVWMHNNKHTHHGSPSSKRNEMGGSGGGDGGGGEGNDLGSGGDDKDGNNYAVNGSPSSS